MKKLLIWVIISALIITGGIMLVGCATFGSNPTGEDLLRIQESKQYNKEYASFENRTPAVIETLDEASSDWKGIIDWFISDGERVPKERLPEITPDLNAFQTPSEHAKAIWFGHSSVFLRMANRNILIDPVFSRYASPIPFVVKRFQRPVLPLKELPAIDYIVISHDHYDHLDMKTVKYFKESYTKFIVPLGVGSHLRSWGIEPERITELDWWQSTTMDNMEFTATPAQHFSGRGLRDKNKTLWASWVIQDANQTIFFSGDSGYDTHFKEIGDTFGPFDLAFIETGQYNERWKAVHMLPHESAQAAADLRAEQFIPIHWGMFELAMHDWHHPVVTVSAEAKSRALTVVTPRLGEIITVDGSIPSTQWWAPWTQTAESETELSPQTN